MNSPILVPVLVVVGLIAGWAMVHYGSTQPVFFWIALAVELVVVLLLIWTIIRPKESRRKRYERDLSRRLADRHR